MRLITHYVFSFASLLPFIWIPLILKSMGAQTYTEASILIGNTAQLRTVFVGLCIWFSLCVNFVLDRAGHNRLMLRGGWDIPVRAWRTHSVYTAPIWGGFIGILTALVSLLAQTNFHLLQTSGLPEILEEKLPLELTLVLLGVYTSYTHLLLDSLTGNGVYTHRHRRVALAHFKYNNASLNVSVILLSLLVAYYILVHTLF